MNARELIEKVMETRRWDFATLADRLGYMERTLKRVAAGEVPMSEPLEKHLQTLAGISQKMDEPKLASSPSSESSLRELPPNYGIPLKKIPIISWAHAGEMISYEELPETWQETLPSDCPDPKAFGLRIQGDCMMPDYREGDIAILMPSETPRIGLPIVAKLKNDGVVFRIFNYLGMDRDRFRLTCINEIYQPLDIKAEELNWIYPVHSVNKKIWR